MAVGHVKAVGCVKSAQTHQSDHGANAWCVRADLTHPTIDRHVPRSAYIHVPFCAHRCGYCNFTLVAGRDDLVEPYLTAIERELNALGEPREVETLYLGGGTPTQLKGRQLERLLTTVLRWHPLAPTDNGQLTTDKPEFSVEANPADLDAETVQLLAKYGVTRVSLGANRSIRTSYGFWSAIIKRPTSSGQSRCSAPPVSTSLWT